MRNLPGALLLSCALLVPVPAVPDERPPLSVTLEADRLSMSVREAVLADVLAEVARASGVAIAIDAALRAELDQERVTVAMDRVPLEDAVRRLLGGRDAMFLYGRDGLAEVRVYGAGPGREGAGSAVGRAGGPDAARSGPPRVMAPKGRTTPGAGEAMSLERALQALGSERDTRVLERALDTLSEASAVPLEPLLEFARRRGTDAELRVQALEVLSDHAEGDERFTRLLRDLSVGDPSDDVREAAKDMLERRGGTR